MSRPRITATRVADENHVVHTIRGGPSREACRVPCPECPWLVETTGNFPAEAFRCSANTAYDMAMHSFACHMAGAETPKVCAGFLLRGAEHSLTARLHWAQGEWLDAKEDERELHESYRAMAVANGVPPDDDSLKRCRP